MSERDEQTINSSGGAGDPVAARLAEVQGRIAAAAARAGRGGGEVTLVAVSKTHPAAAIEAALTAGQLVFGESRVQEALPKVEALGGRAEFHLIGHLQRNKAHQAVGRFALIHSVDSVRLIEELEKRATMLGIVQRVLLELNVSGEASKFGAPPEALPRLIDALERAEHLRGEGLMTIAPETDDPKEARPYFARLRELLASVTVTPHFAPIHLSMGMSGDFEVAIEEGATLVRVGSAIFGAREYR